MRAPRAPRRWPRLAALTLTLVLAGCETVPPVTAVDDPQAAWRARQARLAALVDWTAVGRIAVRSADDAWTATVHWSQRGEHYRIQLSGPLGQGALLVTGRPGHVTVRTAERETFTAADPDELMLARTGFRVPLSGLRYWLLGGTAPGAGRPDLVLDPGGRLSRMRQSGWSLSYGRYGGPEELPLPIRLELESADLAAKVVVSSWRIGA